jgi:[acyl-carrier-protein] S-malonyltransferase
MDNWCIVFPGREAVLKGMDDSFFKCFKEAKYAFEEAAEFCNMNLAEMCYEESIIKPQWQTICLVTHCYAIYKCILKEYGHPVCAAGYSQGEFTACTSAGVFSFPEVLGLVNRLERLLLQSNSSTECMFRLIDIETDSLEKICQVVDNSGIQVSISSYISDKQNIISGKKEEVYRVIQIAKQNGARWAIDLNSDRAYHCPLCSDTAKKSEIYFYKETLGKAEFPVYSCFDGEKSLEAYDILYKLSKQINHPIQWNKIVKNLVKNDIFKMTEIGPGCTVSANSRIADSRLICKWIGCMDDI